MSILQIEHSTRQVSPSELDTLVLCSCRYALGRMTYIVKDICDITRRHAPQLGKQTRNVIIRDIEEAAARAKELPQYRLLGMDMDAREWLSLLEFLKGLPE